MLDDRLRKEDWEVRPIALDIASQLIAAYHYAGRGANTATYLHGLFHRGDFWAQSCVGCAWWIPPTKGAAIATYPENWQGVLSLSRLVIAPNIPKNAASFLVAASMRLIDRERWPALVTYADEWQGHTGAIYRATNWRYVGRTKPERTYVLNGKMIARKAGPRTRTHAEMLALGAVCIGSFAKHKFVHIWGWQTHQGATV